MSLNISNFSLSFMKKTAIPLKKVTLRFPSNPLSKSRSCQPLPRTPPLFLVFGRSLRRWGGGYTLLTFLQHLLCLKILSTSNPSIFFPLTVCIRLSSLLWMYTSKSSHQRRLTKKAVLKTLAIFKRKLLWRPITLIKKKLQHWRTPRTPILKNVSEPLLLYFQTSYC